LSKVYDHGHPRWGSATSGGKIVFVGNGRGVMGKNIILCSDGTGNKGGHGADTNVFRLFNAVDIHNSTPKQITFYDDGVGTNKNTYWKPVTGAFGIGFERDVLDLYEFLARNYDAGDKI